MALLCPVTVPQSTAGGVVGHFVSADQVHSVTADGYELVFNQLLPPTNQAAVRIPIAVNGQILGIYRVPFSPEAPTEQTKESETELDVLLIHTQTTNKNAGTVQNHLNFKLYNLETQELVSVSAYTVDGGSCHPLASSMPSLAVCDKPGSSLGTVAFSTGQDDRIVFLNAFRVDGATTFVADKTSRPVNHGRPSCVPYWISSNIVMMQRRQRSSVSYLLDFVRVEHRAKNARTNYKVTRIDCPTLPPGIGVIGASGFEHEKKIIACVLLTDNTVNTYNIKDNSVDLVDEKRLSLKSLDFAQNEASHRKLRSWFLLPTKEAKLFFISNDGIVLNISAPGKLNLFEISGLPRETSLTPLGLGIFNLQASKTDPVRVVKLRVTGSPSNTRVEHDFLRPSSMELFGAKILRHEYNNSSGSSFWFAFKGSLREHFCKSERTLVAYFSLIQAYPFKDPITGMWFIKDQLLISTAAETAMYALEDSQLKRVPSEFNIDAMTVAAAPEMQITQEIVRFADGLAIEIPLSGSIIAAIDETRSVIASTDTVILIESGHIVNKIKCDEVIIGVDLRNSLLAVCTMSALQVINLDSDESVTVNLQHPATSVACSTNGHVYVGDTKGNVYNWPNQEYFNVSPIPIKSVQAQNNGVIVLAGSHGSVYINEQENIVRLQIEDASKVLIDSETRSGVALVDGIVEIVSLDAIPTMNPRLMNASGLLYSQQGIHQVWGDYLYSFGIGANHERMVERALLSRNLRPIESFEIPSPASDDKFHDYQIFMLSDTKFLEFAKKETQMQNDSFDEDLSDDDDFILDTVILVRILELQPGLGKIAVLAEKIFSIPGDFDEEVVVKFYSPHDFMLFTFSSSCISGHVDPHTLDNFKLGQVETCHDYLYDDSWLPSNDEGVFIVPFDGDVGYSSSRDLQETKPLMKCFSKPKTKLGSVLDEDTRNDGVFEAHLIRDVPGKQPRFVTVSKSKSKSSFSTVSVFELRDVSLKKLEKFKLNDRGLAIIPVNESKIESLRSSHGACNPTYLEALMPEVVVGTSRGGVYLLSIIKDEKMLNALLKIQNVLRKSIEMVDSPIIDQTDGSGIDGSLLMAALEIPEAEPLFADIGLDATELKRTLQLLTY